METAVEYEVDDIISSTIISGKLRATSHVDFLNEVDELRKGSLGAPPDLRSTEVAHYRFCFSMDGCSKLGRLIELGKLAFV